MEQLLCRKEICTDFRINRTTLWRYECEGLRLINGRISAERFAWWLERRDAAKRLGMPVRSFLKLDRAVQNKLLEAALEAQMVAAREEDEEAEALRDRAGA